jgi:gluconolactonase
VAYAQGIATASVVSVPGKKHAGDRALIAQMLTYITAPDRDRANQKHVWQKETFMRSTFTVALALCLTIVIAHSAWGQVVPRLGSIERVASGFSNIEGPTYDGMGSVWFTSDRGIARYDIEQGTTELVVRSPAHGSAWGLMFDPEGRLLATEATRVTRRDGDQLTVLADQWDGRRRFSRPNDLAIDAKGGVYFTDFGAANVFYINTNGEVQRVASGMTQPNGIAISPSGQTLYVAASGQQRSPLAFDVGVDGSLSNERVFGANPSPGFDGLTVDSSGNLYAAQYGLGSIEVWNPQGIHLASIRIPEGPTRNVEWAGTQQKKMYVTSGSSLFAVDFELAELGWISLDGRGDTYLETFDEALGIDATATGKPLPLGWSITDNGGVFSDATTAPFPVVTSLGRGAPIYNAGAVDDLDRALALGVTGQSVGRLLQLLATVSEGNAKSLQLKFDIEAWDAARSTSTELPGEAAFDVAVDVETAEGFMPLVDLGTVSTGATLLPPAQEYLDGNADVNRVSFDSGRRDVNIPAGSKLRVRWTANQDGATTGWVYGLDNVELNLLGDAAVPLQAGDANEDFKFDQLDLVQVQIAAKYLTGSPATWGEGDWNGAPGGSPGNPPTGNGLFDQLDIIAALSAGKYLTGPYAAIRPNGRAGDGQTSVVYNPATGELAVDAAAGTNLTSINIHSAAGIFTGSPAQNLGGSFDNDANNNIFKATFGSSFGSLSFGNVAQSGLDQQFLLNDLTVVGSLAGGGAIGDVDLVYVPEPATGVLGLLAALVTMSYNWRQRAAGMRV